MKKIFNIILSLLIVAVVTIASIPIINAAPQSVTINRESDVMRSYIGSKYNWAKERTEDGKVAYCLDVDKDWPGVNVKATLTGEADAGIVYILSNGYPYKSIVGNDDQDRFITQAAVWWYLADKGEGKLSEDFTTNGSDLYNLRPHIKKLVNDAKNAKASANPTLNVDVKNSDMSLSEDGKYFISESVTPSLTGTSVYEVKVTGAPSGTIVTNTSGKTQNSFKKGEAFQVRIPSNALGKTTTIKVNVTAIGATSKAYIYKPSANNMQRLVVLYQENTDLSKTISFTAKVDKPKVCVDYVIVGDVRPDPDLTDPTPGTSCYDKGTKYNQEKELTTRQENCKFDGWYTNEDLTGKWTDGTALNKDMTLYGAWDCGTTVTVPNTAATLPLIILGVGLVIIAGGVAIVVYRDKKLNAKK